MKIKHFLVEQLHGVLDIELTFYDDLTVVVGRNGSGKTSALSLISDLVRLDLPAIRAVSFSSLVLELNDIGGGQVRITATNRGETRELTITTENAVQVSVPLDLPPPYEAASAWQDAIVALSMSARNNPLISASLTEQFKHTSTGDWLRISKSILDRTRLTFVKLDRTIVAIDTEGATSTDVALRSLRASKTPPPVKDPIEEVGGVTTRKYVQYKRELEAIKTTATTKLLELLFSPIDSSNTSNRQISSRQLKIQLGELKARVEPSVLISEHISLQKTITQFFEVTEKLIQESIGKQSQTTKVGRKTLKEETLQVLLGLKRQQIEELLKIFEQEQTSTAKAYSEIQRYIVAVDKFLAESGKRLEFSPALALSFVISGEQLLGGEVKHRSLKELSSGERQILIVLTYLAFLTGENGIFVIDEPELSLHLRWQSYLIDALRDLRPKGCQIIVATHAPEIAGRARDRCVILSPSYMKSSQDFDTTE